MDKKKTCSVMMCCSQILTEMVERIIIIDHTEGGQDDVRRNPTSRKRWPVSPEDDDDMMCGVCFGSASTKEDLIVLCEDCDVAVHQSCYGIPEVPAGDWRCAICEEVWRNSRGLDEPPRRRRRIPQEQHLWCICCGRTHGPMKRIQMISSSEDYYCSSSSSSSDIDSIMDHDHHHRTPTLTLNTNISGSTTTAWAHVTCSWWNYHTCILNPSSTMEPLVWLMHPDKPNRHHHHHPLLPPMMMMMTNMTTRSHHPCVFCSITGDDDDDDDDDSENNNNPTTLSSYYHYCTISCSRRGCRRSFHPICALESGGSLNLKRVDEFGIPCPGGFCDLHAIDEDGEDNKEEASHSEDSPPPPLTLYQTLEHLSGVLFRAGGSSNSWKKMTSKRIKDYMTQLLHTGTSTTILNVQTNASSRTHSAQLLALTSVAKILKELSDLFVSVLTKAHIQKQFQADHQMHVDLARVMEWMILDQMPQLESLYRGYGRGTGEELMLARMAYESLVLNPVKEEKCKTSRRQEENEERHDDIEIWTRLKETLEPRVARRKTTSHHYYSGCLNNNESSSSSSTSTGGGELQKMLMKKISCTGTSSRTITAEKQENNHTCHHCKLPIAVLPQSNHRDDPALRCCSDPDSPVSSKSGGCHSWIHMKCISSASKASAAKLSSKVSVSSSSSSSTNHYRRVSKKRNYTRHPESNHQYPDHSPSASSLMSVSCPRILCTSTSTSSFDGQECGGFLDTRGLILIHNHPKTKASSSSVLTTTSAVSSSGLTSTSTSSSSSLTTITQSSAGLPIHRWKKNPFKKSKSSNKSVLHLPQMTNMSLDYIQDLVVALQQLLSLCSTLDGRRPKKNDDDEESLEKKEETTAAMAIAADESEPTVPKSCPTAMNDETSMDSTNILLPPPPPPIIIIIEKDLCATTREGKDLQTTPVMILDKLLEQAKTVSDDYAAFHLERLLDSFSSNSSSFHIQEARTRHLILRYQHLLSSRKAYEAETCAREKREKELADTERLKLREKELSEKKAEFELKQHQAQVKLKLSKHRSLEDASTQDLDDDDDEFEFSLTLNAKPRKRKRSNVSSLKPRRKSSGGGTTTVDTEIDGKPPPKSTKSRPTRMEYTRCGSCEACSSPDCRTCTFCLLNMSHHSTSSSTSSSSPEVVQQQPWGGLMTRGVRRSCLMRVCIAPQALALRSLKSSTSQAEHPAVATVPPKVEPPPVITNHHEA